MFPAGRHSARVTTTGAVALLPLLLASGCNGSLWAGDDPVHRHPIARVPVDPDIVQLQRYFDRTSPWLNFDPTNSRKPGGFKMTLYLISAKNQKGAFGDGIIHVIMSVIEKNAAGNRQAREVRRWSYDPEQALLYRVTKQSVLGYAYQLRCNWEDADVLGKEISIRIEFERRDGKTITARPTEFLVPSI
jgi:hypothetical protein